MSRRERFEERNSYRDCLDTKIGIPKCLTCGSSMSEPGAPGSEGDILHCVLMPGLDNVVDDFKVCDLWV
jgi:hypothetical protein